ncbi:MAG: hypothetical protein J5644_03315 [Bacteroidales bacterium]|nr:hypothetical protein [Bacteroidales bacterium]
MKKIVLLICLSCFCHAMYAQKPHSELRHEIGVDAGPASIVGVLGYGTIGFFSALGSAFSHHPIDMQMYGIYGVHYYYQVKPWCQIGVKMTVELAKTTCFADTMRAAVTAVDHYALVSLMPSVRFTYLNRPWVRLYSGVDVGCAYLWTGTTTYNGKSDSGEKGTDNNFLFAFNATIFGVNVGKKFYGLFELNAGYDAMVKIGIGARF